MYTGYVAGESAGPAARIAASHYLQQPPNLARGPELARRCLRGWGRELRGEGGRMGRMDTACYG
jgi:hypothetical protein